MSRQIVRRCDSIVGAAGNCNGLIARLLAARNVNAKKQLSVALPSVINSQHPGDLKSFLAVADASQDHQRVVVATARVPAKGSYAREQCLDHFDGGLRNESPGQFHEPFLPKLVI